mgnify:CR=1 FL=1
MRLSEKSGVFMNRTAYKNRYIKEHYDRINLVIPKGEKDRIKKICSEIGASVNEYLYMLVCSDLADGTSRMAAEHTLYENIRSKADYQENA